jgi:FkbM family methyltransferase
MNLAANKILNRFGFDITRLQPQPSKPYEIILNAPRYQEFVVDLLGCDFKIADSASFCASFEEIFSQEIYKFASSKENPVIIDCGSNYGVSIVYFKSIYPKAMITGIEADPKIFELLSWNIELRNYQDVILINRAILGDASIETVEFHCEGADGGRVFAIEDNKNTARVDSIHLDELLSEPIDFLKMDIEGAETEVIMSCDNLRNVPQLFIEYHSFKDSKQTLSALLDKLASNGFRYYIQVIMCSPRPFTEEKIHLGMDLQLNIFAKKT